jgi:hypothetical protein
MTEFGWFFRGGDFFWFGATRVLLIRSWVLGCEIPKGVRLF